MINRLSHACIWVLDQDEALAFYTAKLGFEVRTDQTMDDFRWVTVGPPDQPDLEIVLIVPRPPMMDAEAAEQVKALVSKGAMGNGVFATDDCRATYEELKARGVEFIQEPAERFYGIEATFRDNSGNWFSLTQRAEVAQGPA
jgi:catechol 2,3-dioxygenase-like lactoylglutathione lyase family enzyme